MIQMPFIDNYWNQTLKTVSVLRWAHNKCQNSKFIIKTDDDTIINISMLLDSLNKLESGISGYKWKNRTPGVCSWYPWKYIKSNSRPYFVFGWFYTVSTDVIPKLLDTIDTYTDFVLDIEDIFVTGILAEKAGVPRFGINQLISRKCYLGSKCQLSKHIAIDECPSSEDMVNLFEAWKK